MWKRFAPWVLLLALPLSLWAHERMQRFAQLHEIRFQLAGSNHSLSFEFPGEDVQVSGTVRCSSGTVTVAPCLLNAVVVGGKLSSTASPVGEEAAGRDMIREETILKGSGYELRFYLREGQWYLKGWIEAETGMRVEVFPSPVETRLRS